MTTKMSYPNWKANVLAIVGEALCELHKADIDLEYSESVLVEQYIDGISEHSAAMDILENTDLGEPELSILTEYVYDDEEFGDDLF